MIIMIDNYDSFTYNLVQYIKELNAGNHIEVYRNDEITIADIEQNEPKVIILSPGPGMPKEAGVTSAVIHHFKGKVPILGVCLGHQAIAEAFGGKVVRARRPMHGKTSKIYHDQETLFRGIPSPFVATRYHSLIVERDPFPGELMVSAQTEEGEVMALRHRSLPIEGVQFHPESILSEYGKQLIGNFLKEYTVC